MTAAKLIQDCDAMLICTEGEFYEPDFERLQPVGENCVLTDGTGIVLRSDGTTDGWGPDWQFENGRLTVFDKGTQAAELICTIQGEGEPLPRCTGVPFECEAYTPATCGTVVGCDLEEGECGGYAWDCGYFVEETACKKQGCTWR
jgi:hypothetical protein